MKSDIPREGCVDSGGMVVLDESSVDEPEKKTELPAGLL